MQTLVLFKLKGGKVIKATNLDELLDKLRESSLNPCDTLQEFVAQTAQACLLQTGAKINTDSTEEFVKSLVVNGFLIEDFIIDSEAGG